MCIVTSLIVDMSLRSDILPWFRANQYLLLLLSAVDLKEGQQILVWINLLFHWRQKYDIIFYPSTHGVSSVPKTWQVLINSCIFSWYVDICHQDSSYFQHFWCFLLLYLVFNSQLTDIYYINKRLQELALLSWRQQRLIKICLQL
jgi:hypothetical protein